MNDPTSDLTDEQLYATMGEHWSDPDKFISGQEYWRRYAAALRAVAALARQGWAPAPDAPDHIATVSNMVASSALPSDVEQALIAASDALTDIAKGRASKVLTPLEWAEGRAFRALEQIRLVMRQLGISTSEPPTVPPVVKKSLTTAPALPADVAELVEWLNSTGELAGSADIEESKRYWRAAELLQHRHPAPVAVSERLPDASDPGVCRMPDGDCWWFDPHADGAWYFDTYQGNYTHWLPAPALPLPAGEGK